MGRVLLVILPIIDGLGFAMVEASVHAMLGWVRPVWDPGLPYMVGMFIVLSIPWVCWRDFYDWLLGTVIGFWSEDAFYWLLTLQTPRVWGCQHAICLYPVWHGYPIDYTIAIILTILIIIRKKHRKKHT